MANKKSHKPQPPTAQGQITKFLAQAKQFIATVPKQYIYIAVAAVVVIGGATVILQPKRTEAKFCSTLNTGMDGIWSRYNDSTDKGSLTQMGVMMNNMSEFSKLMRDLNEVAPPEIENDMKVVAESWDKNMDDGAKNGATAVTNPLGALANGLTSGIVSGIKNGASYKAVDQYATTHCGQGLFSGGSQNSQDAASGNDSEVINLSDVKKSDFKPWESAQKGLIVRTSDALVLIDLGAKKATNKLPLPAKEGRTAGGDSGRSYTINYVFSNNLRYTAATLLKQQCASGSSCTNSDDGDEAAYYDLKEKAIKPTGVIAKRFGWVDAPDGSYAAARIDIKTTDNASFDERDYLYAGQEYGYIKGQSYGDSFTDLYYNIAEQKVVRGEPKRLYNTDTTSTKKQDTPKNAIFDYKQYLENDSTYIKYNGKLSSNLPCKEMMKLLPNSRLLCMMDDGSLKVLDVSNMTSKRTEKDDPNDPGYVVGRLHYDIKDIVTIDTDGAVGSYIISSDFKKIALLTTKSGTTSLYTADLSTGKSTIVGILKTNDAEKVVILKWQ